MPFLFGGCNGNANNFNTFQVCKRRCQINRYKYRSFIKYSNPTRPIQRWSKWSKPLYPVRNRRYYKRGCNRPRRTKPDRRRPRPPRRPRVRRRKPHRRRRPRRRHIKRRRHRRHPRKKFHLKKPFKFVKRLFSWGRRKKRRPHHHRHRRRRRKRKSTLKAHSH